VTCPTRVGVTLRCTTPGRAAVVPPLFTWFWLVMLLFTQSRPATQFWLVAFCCTFVPLPDCVLVWPLLTSPLCVPSPSPTVPV
jgi:hypothetical protein